eukprot:CAMPEP_0172199794 /NCGR_PEP_ID=MMETSP1050-20130122/28901_1 /TAXON_ID=233186 /ORGANISM="Cryptomonas curvata, Strain CCAP979/52" /LENGTH=75 /DNA_ID=CAMNT_0012876887 /DNA_START=72 /DNA_END=295 /DNA_ORIENTATION=-
MEGFNADISDDWEGQWYGPNAAMGIREDHPDDPHDSTLSRQVSGYSLNNPVLARIDYREELDLSGRCLSYTAGLA